MLGRGPELQGELRRAPESSGELWIAPGIPREPHGATSVARAFANAEDEAGFNGDGSSSNGGIVGLKNAVGSAGQKTGSGNAYSELTLADFTGTVAEWYETLVETINDVSAQIHRKTLRGGANFIVTSPEVANVLEGTAGFRAKVTHDADKGQAGPLNVGSMNSKFEVYVDPYFPRNMILVGRKGSSFLESGYVYAPYVPLQTTPTIFDPNDFTPRKAVMTRYGKKMVRPDMYGLVVVQDLQTVI